jgi:hypothetical protein
MNLTSLFLENNLPLSFFFFFLTFNLTEFDICCFNIYIYSINIFTLSSMVQEGLEVDIVENITN